MLTKCTLNIQLRIYMSINWVNKWIQEFTFKINPYYGQRKQNRFKIVIKNVSNKCQA